MAEQDTRVLAVSVGDRVKFPGDPAEYEVLALHAKDRTLTVATLGDLTADKPWGDVEAVRKETKDELAARSAAKKAANGDAAPPARTRSGKVKQEPKGGTVNASAKNDQLAQRRQAKAAAAKKSSTAKKATAQPAAKKAAKPAPKAASNGSRASAWGQFEPGESYTLPKGVKVVPGRNQAMRKRNFALIQAEADGLDIAAIAKKQGISEAQVKRCLDIAHTGVRDGVPVKNTAAATA